MRQETMKQPTLLAGVVLSLGCVTAPCWAVSTGYPGEPTGFSAEDPALKLVWDKTFAASLGNTGKQFFVLDFCHSGGFVDDLHANNRLVYTSNDWDEYGWATTMGSNFGLPFFERVDDAGTSILSADVYATSNVLANQLPQQDDPSGLGSTVMTFAKGDKAFLFSAEDGNIGTAANMDAARQALQNLGWTAANNDAVDPIKTFHGAAANQAALNEIYAASKAMADDGKLFVYIDDHGFSTDIIVDRWTPGQYRYDVTVGLWRGWGTTNQYGITDIRIETGDPDLSHYTEFYNPPGWADPVIEYTWNETGSKDLVVHWSTNDVTEALVSGMGYTIGFDHQRPPMDVDWSTRSSYFVATKPSEVNDAGLKDGRGLYVFEQPLQWSAAANYMGDAGVRGPIVPEPLTMLGVSLGLCGAGTYIRKRAKAAG